MKTEKLGWRDERISRRHREWGFGCPAVDLDFVMAECNYGKAVAVVEYKHCNVKQIDTSHSTYRALVDLAGYRPCFIATYNPEHWCFSVTPLNDAAFKHYSHCTGDLITERRFVRSLHQLRGKYLSSRDEDAISRLKNTLPGDAPVQCELVMLPGGLSCE